MARVRLIHWDPAQAAERAGVLRGAGHDVDASPFDGPRAFAAIRRLAPDAVVIDLSRLPSQGRDVAVALREAKSTRNLPLVFVDGRPEKVTPIRKLLPDAEYAGLRGIRGALSRAIGHPPLRTKVPLHRLAGYSGTPLPKKLGIKAGIRVRLIGAPSGFEATLGDLPEGAVVRRRGGGRADLVIWFAKSLAELRARFEQVAGVAGQGGLWIAWRKRASRVATDLTQAEVRKVGLDAGWVDYKICAIDATWSGLKFSRRRPA